MLARQQVHFGALMKAAWFFLDRLNPSLAKSFVFVVLPLAMLPPAMLYYAGTWHGDEIMKGFSSRDWSSVAVILFFAEMATVGAMGLIIRWIAWLNNAQVSYESAYLLAFAAPTPLWLSSLSLLFPSLFFSIAVCCVALAIACLIIFYGVEVLLRIDEDMTAASIAYGIVSVGLIAWALLLVIVIPAP